MTTHDLYMSMFHAKATPAPKPPQKPRLKRDKRSTAIRLAMRRLRAVRRAQGLNRNGTTWGGKDAKFVPKKWRKP